MSVNSLGLRLGETRSNTECPAFSLDDNFDHYVAFVDGIRRQSFCEVNLLEGNMKVLVILGQMLGCEYNTSNNELKIDRGWAERQAGDTVTFHISFYSIIGISNIAMLPLSVAGNCTQS